MDLDREGCRELVLAVFRLAVCDYLSQRYGHDGPVSSQPIRRLSESARAAAASFLIGSWASHLAEMAGFAATTVWHEVHRERGQSLAAGINRQPEIRDSRDHYRDR